MISRIQNCPVRNHTVIADKPDYDNMVYEKDAVLVIDSTVVKENIKKLSEGLGSRTLIADLQNNGDGIGLKNAYTLLKNSNIIYIAVGNTAEAKKLREFGFKGEILLLSPITTLQECISLISLDITFTLDNVSQADILKSASIYTTVKPRVHLKLDLGAANGGFQYESLQNIQYYVRDLKVEGCYVDFTFIHHFIRKQSAKFKCFLDILREHNMIPSITHISLPEAQEFTKCPHMNAIRLSAPLWQDAAFIRAYTHSIKYYSKGDRIGPKRQIHLRRDSLIASVRIGAQDGLFWERIPSKACIGTNIVSILGKPGDDYILLDFTGLDVSSREEVRIWCQPSRIHPCIPRVLM